MDGIANVARQQQSQVGSQEAQGRVAQQIQQKHTNATKDFSVTSSKINSKEQVQELVQQLNEAMAPISTNLKFGVDKDDVFYVSVIESETSKMLRRFPAEQAKDFLPKMQEVTGILFDSTG